MKTSLCLLALGLLLARAQAADAPRQWTSSDGKSQCMGNLVEFSDKKVKIRRRTEAVKQAGGARMNYSELAGAGHGITGIVYPRTDLHEWLFQQQKRAMSTN